MAADRGNPNQVQAQSLRLGTGFLIQVPEHLDVIRHEADGIDHDKQDDEGIEEQFDHAWPERRSMRLTLPARMGDAKTKNCRRPKDGPPGRGGGRCGEKPGGGVPQAGQCDRQHRAVYAVAALIQIKNPRGALARISAVI